MREYKVIDWQDGSEKYVTDSANDAWNWVMTSESPTILYVTKANHIVRPPKWFSRVESSYDVKKFSVN